MTRPGITKLRTTRLWSLIRPLARRFAAPLFPREAPWVVVRGPAPRADEEALRSRWEALPEAEREPRFVLYRIIGNDLPPRHAPDQSLANLRTLLEHEPPLPGCEKRWVVNRIADPQAEAAVLDLLAAWKQPVLHIPFDGDRYAEQPLDGEGMGTPPRLLPHDARERVTQRLCRFKNCYAVNNNGARNAALEDGVTRAPWVLPWDGNCMLTAEGWESIRTAILERPWYPYWIVPMARVRSITELRPGAPPPAATEEPQIIFRRDAGERFNPDAYYGRRPKVELLWRLGVSGPWDHWYREPWDLPYPHYASDAGAWQRAGWVARLPSGNAAAEAGRGNQIRRRSTREEAITAFLHRCDQRFGTRYPIPARRVAVHISTVHHATDPRIRLKQLRGLRERGWEAHLVTADRTAAASGVAADGVIVHRIRPLRGGRLWRMVITAPRAILRALAVPADIYQLHDPELLPWAWLLLLRGAPVFYDIHEDYALAVAQKRYLPGPLRRPAAAIVAALERALSVPFSLLIAERCYRGRFPRAMDLLNYPERRLLELGPAHDPAARHLLYTGNVTEDRGALLLARLVAHLPEVEVTLVGRCDPRLAERMRRVAGEGAGRLHLVGEGRFVPFAEICSAYTGRKWSAGIALMPDTPHYRDKELTKFFEYMAVGLPIIASDVPVWRRLIADGGVGVCVPPDDPAAVAAVLRRLTAHPHLGEQMSLRAQHLVEKRYHWDGQVDRLVIRYMQVLHEA